MQSDDELLPEGDVAPGIWQSTQALDPSPALYLPGTQRVHGPPFGPEDPGSQRHCEIEELPGSDEDNAGQAEQLASDTSFLYLPAAQLPHGPPSGPLKPSRHRQSLAVALPGTENEFA